MKVSLARDALLAALERTSKVVEARSSIPILANLRIEARAGGGEDGPDLVITGTDLDMEVTTRVAANVEAPGVATVPAATCREFVRKLPEGKGVEISHDAQACRAALKCGRSRVTLASLPAQDFPTINAGEWMVEFSLPARDLDEMLGRVRFAISTEETRYYLNGVYLHARTDDAGTRLVAVATDGHRLGRHAMPMPAGGAGLPGIIVPRKAVEEIPRLLKGLAAEPVSLAASASKLRLAAGATTLVTKLVDDTFPDYDRVIPAASTSTARLPKEALAASVDRIATILTGRSRATKFSFEGGCLTLQAQAEAGNIATDEVEAEIEGPPLEIGFNAGYVLDALRAAPGETIHIAMTDAGSPCLVTMPDAPDSLFVIMPMRV